MNPNSNKVNLIIIIIIIIIILTPWCRVLLEKLTGLQLVKKFPAFNGTRRFITALTSVRQIIIMMKLFIFNMLAPQK